MEPRSHGGGGGGWNITIGPSRPIRRTALEQTHTPCALPLLLSNRDSTATNGKSIDMPMRSNHRGGARSQRGRGSGDRQGRPNSRVQLSKRLTYALRHGAEKIGLNLRPDGFTRLDDLLSNPTFRGVTQQQVEEVVAADDKGRMTIASFPCEEAGAVTETSTPAATTVTRFFIRANQGHSIQRVVDEYQLLTKIHDPADIPVCVHGTNLKCWPSIRKEGLRCMNRMHIHFAAGLPGECGVISGMRRSCKVLIYVDVAAAMSDGIAFFRSTNNVILTSGKDSTLNPRYFSHVEGVSDSPSAAAAVKPAASPRTASTWASREQGSFPISNASPPAVGGKERSAVSSGAAPAIRQPRARGDRMLQDAVGVAEHDRGGRGGSFRPSGQPSAHSENWRSRTGGKGPAFRSDSAGDEAATEEADEVDVYAILDLEATCEDRNIDPGFGPMEVIEFPTVLLDAVSLEVIDEFRAYVRPVRIPVLTPYCTSLTGIQQSTVDGGVLFAEALEQHTEFLRKNSCLPGQDRTCRFVTCGDWDLKTMLPAQCKLIGGHAPPHFNAWANIKHVFRETMDTAVREQGDSQKRRLRARVSTGMAGMLSELGLNLEGRHHSGLDDCRNIARIAAELCRRFRRPIQATCSRI